MIGKEMSVNCHGHQISNLCRVELLVLAPESRSLTMVVRQSRQANCNDKRDA